MSTAERMYDDHPRERWCGPAVRIHPAWIVLLILGFIVWWPVGLAILAFTFWSRKMSCHSGDHWERKMQRMEEKLARVREMRDRFSGAFGGGGGGGWGGGRSSSGNHAFDEYRTETLRRLEEEQRELKEFLNRRRFVKDKAEFDQFIKERRHRPQPPEPPQPQS